MCQHPERWLALYVKFRREKSVKKLLEFKGYQTSLPLRRFCRTRYSGSQWETGLPLITGYVFVAQDPQNPLHIVPTPGVIRILGSGAGASSIRYSEIESLERIAECELPIAECAYTRIGEPAELSRGPLKGLKGIVIREAAASRLVVGVELLQRSLSVEIDNALAAPL